MAKLTITQLSIDDRPREKMMKNGARSLSNAELLAILIGSGSVDETAIELSQRILNAVNNNLYTLGKYDLKQLMTYKGIGEAKAITIMAAMELGRRRREEELPDHPQLNTSQAAYDYMAQRLVDLPHEEFWAILLNRAGRVIDTVMVSKGGTASTAVDVRIIMREAVQNLASAIILCHNHPSGNNQPSRDDELLTRQISDAAKLMNVVVLDHIIVCDRSYYSFSDEGKL
ncbi:MAG: DNA repair protein RadC [Bacteroidaceae bacterium]|nr:DNA repair protein RadC [Bacteroidaceae bacterium]